VRYLEEKKIMQILKENEMNNEVCITAFQDLLSPQIVLELSQKVEDMKNY